DFFANDSLVDSDTNAPYSATLSSVPPGSFALEAVAVDLFGDSVTSAVVTVTALVPPAILTPPQSLSVTQGDAVTFSVVATGSPRSIPLNNLAAGTYQLTARAFDDRRASTLSQPVTISVHDPPVVALT